MTLRHRLDRLEAVTGQARDADPILIHTGVPRADGPHGLVALTPRPVALTAQGARP